MFVRLHRLFGRRYHLFTVGVDHEFKAMLSTLLSAALTVLVFGLGNALIIRAFDVDSFRSLMALGFNNLFKRLGSGFLTGFIFVFASSVLWFFGIHGSDTLEGVMETYFTPQLSANQAAVATGGVPTQIVTKEFFDCFVLMGGCGATICLLIAILLFSRNRARRGLGYAAAFPMIFIINEMMVFGLPIIFNPIMLIPFLVVPLVCYTIAYLAISAGLVPMITSEVAWTTPIILGGYHATGSVAGSILQLVNVVVGVLVYLPFVRMLDRQTVVNAMHNYDSFMDFFKGNE
jgi:lactose/cellobiose-specific phosphotransferase system IIC component